jgi:hypothetical protein
MASPCEYRRVFEKTKLQSRHAAEKISIMLFAGGFSDGRVILAAPLNGDSKPCSDPTAGNTESWPGIARHNVDAGAASARERRASRSAGPESRPTEGALRCPGGRAGRGGPPAVLLPRGPAGAASHRSTR